MAVIHLRRLGELAKPQREIEGRKAMIQCLASTLASHAPYHPTRRFGPSPLNRIGATSCLSLSTTTRRAISVSIITIGTFSLSTLSFSIAPVKSVVNTDFSELSNSDGVKALDLRVGTGPVPEDGDQVAIHYYGRLAAKQGWRFDSTYDHKDSSGEPVPFVFTLGSGKVISGIEAAVRSMKVGGVRRVIIPPSQGYQNTSQEPLPPNFFDRQRLFTTIFNPTRLANGEGTTLGILIFDIELVSLRHQSNQLP